MADESQNIDFLGSGWSFPPVFNKVSGDVEMRRGNLDIRESLILLLSTSPGERFLEPEFGCDLTEMLYEGMSVSLEARMRDKIERAIVEFEPRITLDDVSFESELEEGIIYIHISYTIRSTNSRTNIVFPYYLSEGTDL